MRVNGTPKKVKRITKSKKIKKDFHNSIMETMIKGKKVNIIAIPPDVYEKDCMLAVDCNLDKDIVCRKPSLDNISKDFDLFDIPQRSDFEKEIKILNKTKNDFSLYEKIKADNKNRKFKKALKKLENLESDMSKKSNFKQIKKNSRKTHKETNKI